MPSSCPKVVRNQQPKARAKPTKAQRRDAPALHLLAAPSPFISDGATTEADLCKWADWFARFHTDPSELYVPLALRTVDCIVDVPQETPTVPRLMRCVREVAKLNGAEGIEWKLITWVPGLPGMQCQRCASLDEAMTQLDSPPAPVLFVVGPTAAAASAHP